MATLIQQVFTFRSVVGSTTTYYDVVVDEQSNITVKNFRTLGSIGTTASCSVSGTILDEVNESTAMIQDLVAETQVAAGTITFTGETSNPGAIAPGVLNNTAYRVVYTPPDAVVMRTENKALTSFDAVVASAYGSLGVPKVVSFVVLVSTAASSSYSGVETFAQVDAGVRAITFPTAMASTTYRVVLTPSDFFTARVLSKTRNGFSIEIGLTLGVAQTVDVGFDVFVG